MKNQKSKFLLLATCYWLLTTGLWAEMIVGIEVKGAKTVDTGIIISTSGLEIGDELTPINIKKAIEQIYNTKLFEEVSIEQEKQGGGVKLVIYVKECRVISKVEFEGNKKFKSDKLKEICEVKEKWTSSPSAIFDGKAKIKQAYEKEGYYLAEITTETKEEGEKISVKYLIDEGKRVKIRKINIIGNNAVSDKQIKSKLKNREKYWWAWSGKFNKEEFEGDPDRITEFYHNNGYPNCKIIGTKIIPQEIIVLRNNKWVKENKEWITIEIEVEEGEKFYFGEVKFEGNEVFETKELIKGVKFKKYAPYSKSKLSKVMEWVYGIYSDKGYLYLAVDPVESIKDSIVNITYKMQEGKPARVHKILIQDNVKTHEKVIRRELTILPGEIFSRSKLIVSQRKVFNLGFFKNILLDTRQANPEGDIDLIIKVEEKEAGTASLGASYYPNYGIVGNLSLSAPNFRGQGELFSITVERGKAIENYALSYTKPWIFDTPLTGGMGLYHTFEGRYWYKLQKTGGNISVIRNVPLFDFTKARMSYKLENIKVYNVTDASLLSRMAQGLKSAITFGINRDSRDNFLNPTTGMRNDAEFEFSGGLLGGDIHYNKQVFESSTYHTLFWKFVLGLRGQFGFLNEYGTSQAVYERFVLGGIGKWGLRGYKDWTVGPMIGNEVIGGKFASLFSIEAKIAFPNNIYPLVFFDAGSAWESFSDANLQDLKRGAGAGFRIEIPMMGLVGFDLGYRIDPTPKQPYRGWEFHLQMGRTF
ncbi:MAG: outer membrane protein assembly factor BamA [Candidatus Stahlbacteria bacterium]|nr:outer membrane protein assembly factor BamA [Candidatus Stahlbacteria bacterium]